MFEYFYNFISFLKRLYYYLATRRQLEEYGIKLGQKEVEDKQGRKFTWLGTEDGNYGVFKEIAEKQMGDERHLQAIVDVKQLELRDDDVMICTFPRAGTHWVWEITSMVLAEKAEHNKLTKEQSMLEFQPPAELAALPSPRILNGHQLPVLLPEQMFTKKIKIIHVYRNPKDVAVSFFHFSKKMPMLLKCMDNKPYETFSEWLPYFTGEYGVFFPCSIFHYYNEMERFFKDRPENTLNLCYEDMKRDPVAAVERIAKFLEKDLSQDLIQDIAEKCSFKNLALADNTYKQSAKLPTLDNPGKHGTSEMYRKGEVGDWQNYFTEEENEHFDKLVEKHFKNLDWKFTYTL